ncbi:MAG: ferritin-like domain-containing protein [Candidatus Doudnabacteria bacterium]|nr:ferritin-like domain-containing protein [Candidatus Doudnabacteria bacterium]
MSLKSPETFEELFHVKLLAMYDVEQQLVSALPKMAEAATDPELKQGFVSHLEETQTHVARIEEILKAQEISPMAESSDAIRGMISDAEWCIENIQDPNVLDAALISSAQSVEHYEMALYGTAREWAKVLDLSEIAGILEKTLSEEEKTDEILNTAATKVNKLAYSETKDVDATEEQGFLGRLQEGGI